MIGELEQYHGAALARLIRAGSAVPVTVRAHGNHRSAYALDETVALYVKYSTSRLSPWSFQFARAHRNAVEDLTGEFDETFVTLVCGLDGVACLDLKQYRQLVSSDDASVEWIKVTRRARQKYSVTGSKRRQALKVGNSEYPAKVFASIEGL